MKNKDGFIFEYLILKKCDNNIKKAKLPGALKAGIVTTITSLDIGFKYKFRI